MSDKKQAQPKKSDAAIALERLDEAVRYACAAMHSASGAEGAGVVAGWVMIVDERFYVDGEYVGACPSGVAKPEQPRYISQAIVQGFCERTGVEFYEPDGVEEAEDEE